MLALAWLAAFMTWTAATHRRNRIDNINRARLDRAYRQNTRFRRDRP